MKKAIITKIIMVVIISLYTTNTSFSQTDWKNNMKKDLVKESEGKFYINDYSLISFEEKTFQIKYSAEAPINIISRDNFISIYSSMSTFMMLSMFEAAGYSIDKINIKELDELIGEPDISFIFIMAKNGMQIQVKTDKGTNRTTVSWDDFYKK